MKNSILIVGALCTTPLFSLFEYDRAITYAQKGDWQKSSQTLQQLLVENPQRPDALYDLGVSSFKNAEYEKSLSYFTSVSNSKDAPKELRAQAHFNAGNAQVSLKQLKEALNSYDQALEINPKDQKALHNKEVVKKMLEQQKKEEEKKQNNDKKDQKDDQKENNKDKNEQQDPQNQNSQKDPKDQQGNNDTDNNQDKKQQEKQEQGNKNQEQKKKDEQKKSEQQKDQEKQEQNQKQDAQEKNKKKSGADQKGGQQEAPTPDTNKEKSPQLSPGLSRILEQREKKDAELNKKMIKAMATMQTGAPDDYNCW